MMMRMMMRCLVRPRVFCLPLLSLAMARVLAFFLCVSASVFRFCVSVLC